MGKRVSQQTREELVAALVERYAGSCRDDKARILDEFGRITGYHRKHAIRLLGRPTVAARDGVEASVDGAGKPRERTYDEAFVATLIVFWEAAEGEPRDRRSAPATGATRSRGWQAATFACDEFAKEADPRAHQW